MSVVGSERTITEATRLDGQGETIAQAGAAGSHWRFRVSDATLVAYTRPSSEAGH